MLSGLAMLRDDCTLTNCTRAGYEKENIGEAVEQVSAQQAGTRSFLLGGLGRGAVFRTALCSQVASAAACLAH